jgi:hypothetical protein
LVQPKSLAYWAWHHLALMSKTEMLVVFYPLEGFSLFISLQGLPSFFLDGIYRKNMFFYIYLRLEIKVR